jgi:sulfite exporter TauE/SafE
MVIMESYWLAFITGLTTGGVSCFAVQGSLLMSSIATEEEEKITKKLKLKGLILFLIAKLAAYTLLGLLLGFLGEKIIIGPKIQGWFQIIIGLYMLVTAANLANLHPFFRRFTITPPKFILKILRNQSKIKSFFTPIFLGTLTVFIPCGVTQGMMLLAISAGNPISSALILFSFVLGTSPVFFLIGYAATELFKKRAFSILAGVVVAVMGIVSINSGQILRGSVHTFQNYWRVAFENLDTGDFAPISDGYQEVEITVTAHGYQTNVKKLKAGIPVRLILSTNSVAGCSRAFTVPDYNISKILPVTGTTVIEFTPEQLGNLTYTCSMGMYSGYFDIIK